MRFPEHPTDDGLTVFDHVCRLGPEGIVSKRTDAPDRSGPSKTWLKSKNPESEVVRREREEEWHEDVRAFIVSQNIKRRHLNADQRAMAVAMIYPKGTPGKKSAASSAAKEVSAGSLSQARTVLADIRANAEEVMSGAKFLDTAYQEAKAKLDDKNADEVIAGINVTARSSTTLQSASGHCCAKTRRSDVADQQMTTNPKK